MKTYETGQVKSINEISPMIFDMEIECRLNKLAVPGQFVMIYPMDKSTILPRPISICEVMPDGLRFVYRIAGKGTKEFSTWKKGDKVRLLGPIGNGFPIEAAYGKSVVLMGGGIGIPPILELSKALRATDNYEVAAFLGYRDNSLFLKEDFDNYCEVYVATEDGSAGIKGNVMDALAVTGYAPEVIFACGPMPMLRAIKAYAKEAGIEAYISLEERMACGVGACLGCVTNTTKEDAHSHVNNARVCTEGPVFEAKEVNI